MLKESQIPTTTWCAMRSRNPSTASSVKFDPVNVQVDNQFGKQILTVKKSELLCAPSSKTVLGPAGDHDDDDDDDHDGDHGQKERKGHK